MFFDYQKSQSKLITEKELLFESRAFKAVNVLFLFVLACLAFVIYFDSTKVFSFKFVFIYYFIFFGLVYYLLYIYFLRYLTHHKNENITFEPIKSENLAEYLSFESCILIKECLNLANKYKISAISPAIILYSYDKIPAIRWFLFRVGFILSDNDKLEILSHYSNPTFRADRLCFDKNFENIINLAYLYSQKDKRNLIEIYDILLALASSDKIFQNILFKLELKNEDVVDIINWYKNYIHVFEKKYYWQKDTFEEGVGYSWASGYTPVLNMYSSDISSHTANSIEHYQSLSHKKNISQIEQFLINGNKNSILLIGDQGVGKKGIVSGLAYKIANGKSNDLLNYKHIIELSVSHLLSGPKDQIENRFIRILDEAAYASNIIIFIDNFTQLLSSDPSSIGSIDASTILLNYLAKGKIRIIATANYDDFRFKIESNPSLKNLFSILKVEEPTPEETINILEEVTPLVEYNNHVFYVFKSIKKIVELSKLYIHDLPFPQKAIDLLNDSASSASANKKFLIYPNLIESIVTEKTKIPVSNAGKDESKTLLNLEEFLHKRVIGQNEAIRVISDAIRRARSGLSDQNKPFGSFLFIGPTGVGKTETAKALAEAYFKNEKNMIRFDMSEFQEAKSIEQLIGTSAVSKNIESHGRLTQAVHDNPYTLVLFDEIEKAHPSILNLFLQILDEGRLTDAAGRVVDFSNTIVISTSNAGSEKIRAMINDKTSTDLMKKNIIEYLQQNNIFKPEFLNRFDAVVCYKPLNQLEVIKITKLMLNKLSTMLKSKDVNLIIEKDVVEKIAKIGFDPLFGARPIKRVIQEKIENLIAKKILKGEVSRGQSIKISTNDF